MAICCIFRSRNRKRLRSTKIALEATNTTDNQGINTVDTYYGDCEFSGSSFLCVSIITWNMNGRVWYEDLKELVGVGTKRKYDLLVIGLQEAPGNKISKLLKSALSPTHVLLGKSVMQSLQLYTFGPMYSEFNIKELKIDKYAVGGCGTILMRRNKGAVAIRIEYKGVIMLFVACHLSAHVHNVEERNSQLKRISEALFSTKLVSPFAGRPQLVVWLGDLNYRLQGIDSYPARDLIHSNLQSLLTPKDQLLREAERGAIFQGYNEGTLSFKPTYKYDIGSSNYDTSHKVRAPAWTDRILFKNEDPDNIRATLHCYDSMDSIHGSDHKPVKAHLCLNVKI
ncbi:hypothetical protein V2J09_007549 [Rumex salicifolius]